MTKEIEVTQHFIDTGTRQSCSFCPVALAIIAALGLDNLKILVNPNHVGFYPKNNNDPNSRYAKIALPPEVYSWIMNFDGYEYTKCEPFKFILSIPDFFWKIIEKANRINR